jgi:hypothetical protein
LDLLVDQQWNWRENQALGRRLNNKLRANAFLEEIDYRGARGPDKNVIRALAQESAWVGQHRERICVGTNRCRQELCGLRPGAWPAPTAACGLLPRLSRIDALVIDDRAMASLSEPEHRDFWEICEDRYQVRSTILTSQLPVSKWHEQIGDPTLADGILHRLVHNAHRIEMWGDSMRKNRGKPKA